MASSRKRKIQQFITGTILFLALIALVVTGFGTGGFGSLDALIGGQATGTTIARVEGRKLSEQFVTDTLNRQYAAARQSQSSLDLATFLEGGTFDRIVNQLIADLALQAFGEAQGLTVSQRMVDREIVRIPAFRGVTGQFDPMAMQAALRGQNVTEGQLRDDIARQLMQRQLLAPIVLTPHTPNGIARAYADLLLEQRTGAIGLVPTRLFTAGVDPTDAQVQAFYDRHRSRFIVPERRVLQYAVVSREQALGQAQVTDAEIQQYYRDHDDTYGERETRTLRAIVLPDEQAARAFAQRVRGGGSFVDAARAAGFQESDVTFADRTRQQFQQASAPNVAAAAFGAAQGALVGPVRSPLGYHVIQVAAINRTPARSLESVRDEIATTIRAQKADEAFATLVNRLQDRISEGASLPEIAREERLQVVTTPALTREGRALDRDFALAAELTPLLEPAFEIDADHPELVVAPIVEDQRYAILGLGQIMPAAPPPLASIRERVREAARDDMALQRARQVAQGIVEAINRGTAPAEAFAAARPAIPAPRAITMRRQDLSRAGGQVPAPLLALFSLPEHRARLVHAPGGEGWYVVHHQQRTPGDASDQAELVNVTRAQFNNSAPDELAQQFARAIELNSRISRNEREIAAVRARMLGGTSEE